MMAFQAHLYTLPITSPWTLPLRLLYDAVGRLLIIEGDNALGSVRMSVRQCALSRLILGVFVHVPNNCANTVDRLLIINKTSSNQIKSKFFEERQKCVGSKFESPSYCTHSNRFGAHKNWAEYFWSRAHLYGYSLDHRSQPSFYVNQTCLNGYSMKVI